IVRVRDDTVSVWVPEAAPSVMYVPVYVVSIVTLYVPDSAITTESPAEGTRPRLQFDGVLQRPPAEFVHAMSAPVTCQFTSAPPAVAVCAEPFDGLLFTRLM